MVGTRPSAETGEISRDDSTLTPAGTQELKLETKLDAGIPYSYSLEGDVEDVSRQHIANRASITVHPAPWYVGIRQPSYFVEQKAGLKTEVVTVSPEGLTVAGVPVTVTLTQVQWLSVRRAEGNGFYTWDTERKEVPAGSWTVTTAADAVPLEIPIPNGGYYVLEAVGKDENGRSANHQDLVLCPRRGIHGVGALRPQPNRAGSRKENLQARRHRTHHDSVALGTGDRARHDRA